MWNDVKEELGIMSGSTMDIDKMLNFCKNMKEKGATEIFLDIEHGRGCQREFTRAFKVLTPEEIKAKKIEDLKRQIKELEEK